MHNCVLRHFFQFIRQQLCFTASNCSRSNTTRIPAGMHFTAISSSGFYSNLRRSLLNIVIFGFCCCSATFLAPNRHGPFTTFSSDTPFFYFHQRKTGGTSFRDMLYSIAKARNISAIIPCFGAYRQWYSVMAHRVRLTQVPTQMVLVARRIF